jgi:subtilisin-like proprotein convertase family protein
MKKLTFFCLAILFITARLTTQPNTDEYGFQNCNRYLSGLGIAASYVNVPSQAAFDQNSAGSIEMWIYPTSFTGNTKTLISKGATSNVSFLWGLSASTGRMFLSIGNFTYQNSTGASPPLNTWSHVAVTWSGGPNFAVKFYLNGAQTGSTVTNTASWNVNNDPIRIGGSQAFNTNAFIGNIDEVRFWGIELPASKIASNRFAGIGDIANCNSGGNLTVNSYYSGLISSWTFNATNQAYDYISNFHGTYLGSAASAEQTMSSPLPYNFALKLGGSSGDYILVPSHSNFNQNSDGTLEAWFKPISFSTEQILISKGASASTISFILGVTAGTGKLYFGSGNSIALNSTGSGLALNKWNHIAVTWSTSGSSFIVTFYLNGKLNGSPSTITRNFPTNNDMVYIGKSQVYNLPAKGWIDELRLWHPALTNSEITKYMFVSSRSFSTSNLLAAWNFDGTILNFAAATPSINGFFNTGSDNNCRFSGFTNDSVTGAFSNTYISHISVINRKGSPNPFPQGFNIRSPNLIIPDNNATGVSDSIIIANYPGLANKVEIFLSVEHTWVGDLTITLRAPNGQTRIVITANGGAADNIMSFFNDDFTYLPSNALYLPPWGYAKPISAFGNFGSSSMEGTWVIKCVDGASSDIGSLLGWGIRFNNLVSVQPVSGIVPDKYNLYQNYPNPFNPVTTIKFDLPRDENVKIFLYDVLGRETASLVNEFKKAGSYEIKFDGINLASGTYFYRIEARQAGSSTIDFVDTKKMILVK